MPPAKLTNGWRARMAVTAPPDGGTGAKHRLAAFWWHTEDGGAGWEPIEAPTRPYPGAAAAAEAAADGTVDGKRDG